MNFYRNKFGPIKRDRWILSLFLSSFLPPLERNPRTDNSLNRTMRFLDTYPRASFIFPLSFLHFLFFLRSLSPSPSLSLPSFLPPSPKRGLHAFALRGHRSLLTRDRTHHATFSSAFLAEWSIFRERGGKEGDGAYNWVQLGPAGACSASKDSSLPPSPPSRASRRRKFELRNNATVTRDPLSKGVF